MAWLDQLLSMQGAGPLANGGFPALPQEQFNDRQQAEIDALTRLQGSQPKASAGSTDRTMAPMGMLGAWGSPSTFGGSTGGPATLPPSTNDPLAREPEVFKDGVPLPRPRPPGAGLGQPEPSSPMSLAPPEDGALPANSAPAVGGAMPNAVAAPTPAAAPSGMDFGGILGKILNPANAPMLLAMGGGFSGASSLGAGMRRGFSAAAPQAALLRKEQVATASQAETYKALVGRGVPPQDAISALRNPEIMKAVVAKYFETKPAQTVNNRLVREMPDGSIKTLADYSDPAKPQVVNNRMVNSDGTVIADFSDTKNPQVVNNRLVRPDGTVIADYSDDKSKPEWKEVARDRWGNPIHGFVDPKAGTINGKPLAQFTQEQADGATLPPPTTAPSGYPTITPPSAAPASPPPGGVTGASEGPAGDVLPGGAQPVSENRNEEYLTSLNNPGLASQVKAISEGRAPYPSGQIMRTPYGRMLTEAIASYDPSFDAVNYKSRESTRKDFTSGKSAQNLTAFNTAIGHLETLDKSIDGLNNSNFTYWNKLANAVSGSYDPKFQASMKQFQAARTAVADELTRAFRGSGGNVHDIKQWEDTINAADSPAALRSAVKQAAELLRSRIESVGDQYNRGMGTTKDVLELLNPKASEAFKRLHEQDPQRGSGATAVAPRLAPGASTVINGVTIKRLD